MTDAKKRQIIERVRPWIEQNPPQAQRATGNTEGGEGFNLPILNPRASDMRSGGLPRTTDPSQGREPTPAPQDSGSILTEQRAGEIDAAADQKDSDRNEFEQVMSQLSDAQLDQLLEESIPRYLRNDRASQSQDQRDLAEYVARRKQGAATTGVGDWR
jgi:hypothetical protein